MPKRFYPARFVAALFAVSAVSTLLAFFALSGTAHAIQSIPYKMNFQGRLTDSTGAAMPAGTYNMKFRIYDASTGGTLLWSEQRANSAGTGVTVTTGGLFSVQLGDVTSLPVSIFNNANPIYFEIELPNPATATCTTASCESYTEGPMTPRSKLGSSAYAFNSDTLDGHDSTYFAPASGSGSYIQNQNSSPQTTTNFWIDGTGRAATLQGDTLVGGSGQQFSVTTSGDVAFGGVANHTISIGAAGDGVNASNLVLQGGDGTTPITAPTIVNSTISYVNNANTVTASYPAGIQAGDIMIMVVGQAYTMSGTPSGWTMLSNNGGSTFVSGYTLSKTVTAGDVGGSTTVNFASPYYGEVSIIAVRHVSGVRNVYASQSSTGSTSETIGPVNVQAGDMVIYGGMVRLTNGDIGITTGTVQQKRNTDTNAGALLGYELAASTGTKSQTFTVNATPSGRYYALVSLIPAVSNGGSVVLSGGTATVGTGGNVIVKNALNVVNAFTVQNAAGTDQFVVDAANTRIGVGTSAPAYTIDATGSIRATTSVLTPTLDTTSLVALNVGASSSAINLNQSTTVAAGKSLTFAAGGGNFDQSASTGTFKTSSGANTLGGNTTIASGKSFTVQGAATFQNATNSGSGFAVNNAAGSSLFKVDTGSGRIGINSSSPSATLDVYGMGPAYVNGFESGVLSPFTTSTPGQWGVQTSAKARSGAYTLTGNYNGDGAVGTSYTTSLTETLNAAGTISFYYGCDWSYNAVNAPIASFNVDGGTTNYLSDAAGNCNGSLSNGTTYAYASYAVASGTHTFNFVYHMSTGSSPSNFRIRIDDLTVSNVGTTGAAALFNNGGVGINLGTTVAPTAMLDVNGETKTSLLSVGGATSTSTFSLQGGMIATQLSTPAAPTITNVGTAGTTSYSYTVTALDGTGETVASTAGTTPTGNATLDATNYNAVTWTTVPGAVSYNVYRTATGGTPATTGYIGNVAQTTTGTASLNDTGLAGSGSAPTVNTTGGIQAASGLTLGSASTTTGSIALYNGASAYHITLQSASETVGNATITIPDTAGVADTVCLQTLGNCGSGGGGAATNLNNLTATAINQSLIPGSTYGNSLDLGSSTYTWANGYFGTAVHVPAIRPLSDSTTALKIQNAAGTNDVMTVDTTNSRVSVGTAGTAFGQLYVSGELGSTAAGATGFQSSRTGHALAVQGNYVYTLDYASGNNALEVYDTTNPTSPTIVNGTGMTLTYGVTAGAIAGHYLYAVGGATSNNFHVIDIANPASPTDVKVLNVTGTLYAVAVQGNYVYVLNNTANLYIYNISNPANPVLAGSLTSIGATAVHNFGLSVQGNYAYITAYSPGNLYIVDVSNPASPSVVNTGGTSTGSNANQVVVKGRYAYIANQGYGTSGKLAIMDISNPASPFVFGPVSSGIVGAAISVSVQGNRAYLLDDASNLYSIDISDPSTPTILGSTTTNSSALQVVADGRYAYVSSASLQLFDLGGSYIQQFEAGGVKLGSLNITGQASFAQSASINGGLSVGNGLQASGNSGFSGQVRLQNSTDSASAFQVQNTSNNTIFGVDTLASQAVFGTTGTLGASLKLNAATSGSITIAIPSTTSSYTLTLPSSAGSVSQCLMNDGTTAGTLTWGPCAGSAVSKVMTLAPEYAGAVLDATSDASCSAASSGTMTAGYDSTNRMNYYNWTSSNAANQCYDVVVQVPIPSDWSSWNTNPINIQLKTDNATNGSYAIQIIDSTGTTDANYNYSTPGTLGTSWGNMATNTLSGTYTAGNYFTIKIRTTAKNSANVQLGNITLNYIGGL